ncbi:ATP-dependent DNA helicase [Granulosicoccus sp. 3-233]|uniref:ATP-dependent DNA helicase n=1 Tax=Granulosicoccus sp. 3-233 TaxID=3417969 RepID=UPI003D32EBA1
MSQDGSHRVSVTSLAAFSCRSGDLFPEGVAGPTARQGMRAHQKIQREAREESKHRDSPIETEVILSAVLSIRQHDVTLGGRVDLLDRQQPRLSEIKTTLVPAAQLPSSQQQLQWSQLYLYGHLYLTSIDSHAESVELELIHMNIRSGEQETQLRQLDRQALQQHTLAALETYVIWLEQVQSQRRQMQHSASLMKFPHADFRAGQRDMSAAIYRCTRDAQVLMCEAPTGIGKTVSALFPGIKSLGEGGIAQIAYLTAKVAGRLSALQSLQHMQASGLIVSAVQIRAKQPTCFCSNGRCDRDEAGRCPMTIGFFDRLPAAREELLACGIMHDSVLDEIAWQHQLCPFELALQLLPWVHVVIADYNYVFDPLVRLQHFSEDRSDTLLLIDEAHNLLDRSRSMYSAQLNRLRCLDEAAVCRQHHPQVANALDRLAREMRSHVREQEAETQVSEVTNAAISRRAADVIEAMVASHGQAPGLKESSNELFRTLCRYVVIHELFAEQHRDITQFYNSGRRKQVEVMLFCQDASAKLQKQYRQFKATVVFSATLRPATFYRDALGLPESTACLQLSSPFDPARALHCVVDWIDTRYLQRQASLPALIELVHEVCAAKPGNYLVFFPSHAYLNQAYSAYVSRYPQDETWKQDAEHSREQQPQILASLEEPGHRVGFAIQGGIYGEGINYAGDRLIGVIVVSPGLPGLDTQTRLISEHYQRQGHDGFDFAYRYPGLTRVLQTVGRLIRNESDGGVVLLVDTRFRSTFYQRLFPGHWQLDRPGSAKSLVDRVEQFWSGLS